MGKIYFCANLWCSNITMWIFWFNVCIIYFLILCMWPSQVVTYFYVLMHAFVFMIGKSLIFFTEDWPW
jgi:hypothetical protein